MRDLFQDFRFAIRILRKRPGASLVIILTLALGIGINSTFFGSLYAMAFRPLPFEDPQELVQVYRTKPEAGRSLIGVGEGTLLDWRKDQQVFSEIGSFTYDSFNLNASDLPERVEGSRISSDLFPMLGIIPAQGRLFTAEEGVLGGPRVALVSQSLWRRSLGQDPEAIGRSLKIDDETYEIVGIMQEDFAFPLWHEIWIPHQADPSQAGHGSGRLQVIGRLADGIDLPAAQQAMESLSRKEVEAFPEEMSDSMSVAVVNLHDAWLPPITQAVGLIMQGLVTLVLLIVCANVANMVLAQSTARRQELALRSALGAGRARLVRQSLVEVLLLAGLGGGLGLLIAAWQVNWVEGLSSVPIPYWLSFEFEPPIFFFTVLVTFGTAMIIGMLPSLSHSTDQLSETLKSGGRADSGTEGGRLRRVLVVAEYAMAVIILVSAMLMVRAYQHIAESDQGYAVDQRLSLSLALTGNAFDDLEAGISFVERALHKLSAVPGARSVAAVSRLPVSRDGYLATEVEVEGLHVEQGEAPLATLQAISENYFHVLDIPLNRGRSFRLAEQQEGRPVVVINQRLADHLWPGVDPLGRRIRTDPKAPWLTIVGTAGDIRPAESIAGIDEQPKHQLYVPLRFTPAGTYQYLTRTPSLVISSPTSPKSLGPVLRQELAALDSQVAVFALQPIKTHLQQHYFAQLIWSRMFSLIGAVALVIAALGAYGVSAFSVSRRIREMGIRLALGEAPNGLMVRIVSQGLKLAALGLGLGLLAAVPLAITMKKLLHGVAATDPLVMGGVIVLLAAVAVSATFFPARRAAGVDPVNALRQE